MTGPGRRPAGLLRAVDFLEDARRGPAALRARSGDAYLLHRVPLEELTAPQGPLRDPVVVVGPPTGDRLARALLQPLVSRRGRPFERVVLIGRSRRCDVPIPDVSVSQRHALVGLDDAGPVLVDLGSVAGTRLGGRPVPDREEGGQPVPLSPGDEVRLGDVVTTFLDAAGVVAALASLGPGPRR